MELGVKSVMNINKKKTISFARYILTTASIIFFLIASSLSAYAAEIEKKGKDSRTDDETKMYIQKLEKRISDLESLVNKLLEDRIQNTELRQQTNLNPQNQNNNLQVTNGASRLWKRKL
jgi:hypothetical protein